MVIRKSELPVEHLPEGRSRQWLANRSLGTEQTALVENIFEPGGWVPAHVHDTEELLVCINGRGQIIINQQVHDFPAGGTAIIPAGAVHEVRNVGEGQMHMLGFFPKAAPSVTWVQPPTR